MNKPMSTAERSRIVTLFNTEDGKTLQKMIDDQIELRQQQVDGSLFWKDIENQRLATLAEIKMLRHFKRVAFFGTFENVETQQQENSTN